jgi:hypothetical protein
VSLSFFLSAVLLRSVCLLCASGRRTGRARVVNMARVDERASGQTTNDASAVAQEIGHGHTLGDLHGARARGEGHGRTLHHGHGHGTRQRNPARNRHDAALRSSAPNPNEGVAPVPPSLRYNYSIILPQTPRARAWRPSLKLLRPGPLRKARAARRGRPFASAPCPRMRERRRRGRDRRLAGIHEISSLSFVAASRLSLASRSVM